MNRYCLKCMHELGVDTDVCENCGHNNAITQNNPASNVQLQPGTILKERFLVGYAIGHGGFGITYIGRDMTLNVCVAIKEYFPNGYAIRNTNSVDYVTITNEHQKAFIESGKEKFLQEARDIAGFYDVDGIVNVIDCFEANGTAYIVMEYLEGQDLKSRIKQKLFTADGIFELMNPVLDALELVHNKKIIHRDISPDNIMLCNNGKVKLMDFGAARTMNYEDQKSMSIVLKAGYAPEEQYRSKGLQGPWTDIYALCATIYKCITGITPDDSLQRSFKDVIRWPSEMGIQISEQQEKVLKKGMAVRYTDRYQSIAELKVDLFSDDDTDDVTVPLGNVNNNQVDNETLSNIQNNIVNESLNETVEYKKTILLNQADAMGFSNQNVVSDDTISDMPFVLSGDNIKSVSIKKDKGKKIVLNILIICLIVTLGAVLLLGRKGSNSDKKQDSEEQISISSVTDVATDTSASATDATTEKTTEQTPETTTECTTEATTECTTEATTERTTEATTTQTIEITTERTTEYTTETTTERTTEATTERTTEATTERTTEATTERTTEATTENDKKNTEKKDDDWIIIDDDGDKRDTKPKEDSDSWIIVE